MSDLAEKAKQKGNEEFAAKKYDASIISFTEAIKHDPSNHVLYSNRSAAYLKVKDYAKALADGEKSVQLKNDFGKGYVRQGQALHAMGEYGKAISVYAAGLAYDPSNDTLTEGLAASQKALSSAGTADKKKKKKGEPKKKDDTKEDVAQKAVDDATVDAAEEKPEDEGEPADFEHVIGIDLGTTYSCVGVWQGDHVHIIENKEGERTIPSYVAFIPPEGDEDVHPSEYQRMTGMHAKNQLTRNPHNTVFDVKRIIGRSFNDQGVDADIRKFPYAVVRGPDNKPLVEIKSKDGSQKQNFAPEEISSMVLTTCKELAEKYLGKPVKKAVITVPAYFNDAQRNATKAAGIIAGLDVLRIINEPTAAALSYGLDRKSKEAMRVLIFDLGGGTFDVSVLSIENGIFTVLATGGDTRLGGEDFDNAVVEFLLAEVEKDPKHPKVDPRSDSKSIQRLRKAVEQAKRQLSSSSSAQIVLDAFITPKYNFRYTLTRQIFERLNKGYFTLCLDVVKRVLKDAKLKNSDIDEIVLVGGSTRIPKIQELLQEAFNGKALCKSVNPDEAVAYGAAVQGAILSGQRNAKTKDLLLMDVTPLSLGIETTGRVMSVIIPRNTPIPCVKMQTYTTEQNYQTKVDVAVYEGERLKSDENNLLGEFTISGIESAKRGEPQVDVSFAIDSNGILLVTAKDQKTGAHAKIEIANRSRASNEDIERMVQEAEKYKKMDQQRIQKIEAKNELEAAINQVLEVAERLGNSEKKLAQILRDAAEKEQAWLDDGEAENAKVSDITKRRRDLQRRIQNKVEDN